MVAATPPVPSFGALARAALADDDWPPSSRPQPRSLEALLGKLDRDLELGWLAERPAVRKCLARALRCPVESLERGPAREPAGPGGGGGRVRLEPLRFGRALDLREEALFPGIPAEVLRPARWGRLWWVAPPGAGQSLVGRWLAARGLADPVALTCSSEARSIAGPARPLFVELQRDDGLLPDLDAPVCVAAPFPPGDGSFAVVRSPPVQDVLPALVAWAAARLPADGGFDVERTLEWFARGALASGVVDTVETALGLCGALDEIGFRAAVREPLAEVARRFVGRRVGELTRAGHADAAWLRRSAHELLVELMTRLLVEPTNPWHDPRSLDAWLALVPEEFQREVDVDWMRALLASDDGPIRSRDVERAARRLPPGAFRVVRGLRAAGLLEEVGPGGDLALRPRWLGRVLAQQARQRLARGAPLELGAGLLSFEAEIAQPAGCAAAISGRSRTSSTSRRRRASRRRRRWRPSSAPRGWPSSRGWRSPRSCWRRWPRSSSAWPSPSTTSCRGRGWPTGRPRGVCSGTAASGWPRSRSRRVSTACAPGVRPSIRGGRRRRREGCGPRSTASRRISRRSPRSGRSRPTRWWTACGSRWASSATPATRSSGRASRWTSSRSGSRPGTSSPSSTASRTGRRPSPRSARGAVSTPTSSAARSGAPPSRPA